MSGAIFGITSGEHSDLRYLELEAMATHRRDIFYNELGFEETGSQSAMRAAALATSKKS